MKRTVMIYLTTALYMTSRPLRTRITPMYRRENSKRAMEEPACFNCCQDGRRHNIYGRVDLAADTDNQRPSRGRASRADAGSAGRCHRESTARSGSDTRQLPDYKDISNTNMVDVIRFGRSDESW